MNTAAEVQRPNYDEADQHDVHWDSASLHELQHVTDESLSNPRSNNETNHERPGHLDGDLSHLDDLQIPLEEFETEDATASGASKKTWILLTVAGVGFVTAIGVLGFMAYTMFFKHQGRPARDASQFESTQQDPRARQMDAATADISSALTAKIPTATTAVKPVEVSKPETAASPAPAPAPVAAASAFMAPTPEADVSKAATSEPVVTRGESVAQDPVETRASQQVMVSSEGQDVSIAPPSIVPVKASAEDAMYDEVLKKMPGADIPPEAIKIDPNVIKRQLETQRLGGFEQELAATKTGLEAITVTVSGYDAKFNEVTKLISRSNDNTAASVKQVQDDLKASNDKTDAQIKALKVELLAAIKDVKETKASPAEVKPAAAAAVKPVYKAAPVAQQRFAAPAPATSAVLPTASRPASVVAPAAPDVASAAPKTVGCPSKGVSAVWRVKGVTDSSAYLVRVEDGYGLFVREETEIPGFGVAKSFNPLTRTVCSTSGTILR